MPAPALEAKQINARPPDEVRKKHPFGNHFIAEKMVPGRGLEPPRRYQRQHLKLVRLPIPPSGHYDVGQLPDTG